MASFSNFFSFLFFTSLLLSLQINARDSQFFSKVTHANNGEETQLPTKEEAVSKAEQEPVFVPETDNSYGLYGHESGQLPTTTAGGAATATTTTTTTTYQPYKTESEEYMSKNPYKEYSYYNKDAYNTNQKDFSNSNNNYYKKDAYGGIQNAWDNTKFTEGVYNSVPNQERNNQKYYNSNNRVNDRYNYDSVRQGMSDTRFMEGGKYYYNVESEKYNPTFNVDSTRGVRSKNWENNRGYFGGYNHPNSYENNNSMEGYQNQDEFEP